MNTEKARFNMVEQQIRPWNVLDPNVLDLLFEVRREEFVPESYRSLAFADIEIPLTPHAVMMPPRMEARMLQELELSPDAQILEVGTGSGYMTALLASQGAEPVRAELTDADSLTKAANGVDAIFHTAADTNTWRVNNASQTRTNVGGIQNLIAAAKTRLAAQHGAAVIARERPKRRIIVRSMRDYLIIEI